MVRVQTQSPSKQDLAPEDEFALFDEENNNARVQRPEQLEGQEPRNLDAADAIDVRFVH